MSASIAKVATIAIGLCLLALQSANAEITFCNKFPHLVYVAVAYPQQDGSWISRGWLNVNTGSCTQFDSALQVKSLYYRAESVSYREGGRSIKNSWGANGTQFAIWEDDNFNYWNAQTKVLNSSLAMFSKGGEASGQAVSVTITFEADGVHTTIAQN